MDSDKCTNNVSLEWKMQFITKVGHDIHKIAK